MLEDTNSLDGAHLKDMKRVETIGKWPDYVRITMLDIYMETARFCFWTYSNDFIQNKCDSEKSNFGNTEKRDTEQDIKLVSLECKYNMWF